jgi:hypothetical protein
MEFSASATKNQFLVSNPRRIGKGTLIASFDLEAPCGIKVIGAMLLEKGGKRWINFPSREWPREDGTRGFAPLLEWTDSAARARFQRAVVPLAEKAFALDGAPFDGPLPF